MSEKLKVKVEEVERLKEDLRLLRQKYGNSAEELGRLRQVSDRWGGGAQKGWDGMSSRRW